jgi:hypothetical protein
MESRLNLQPITQKGTGWSLGRQNKGEFLVLLSVWEIGETRKNT